MDIKLQPISDLHAKILLQIEKNDYAERIEKVLKDYKKRANVPGFRPGHVPMQLIQKMYGKSVLYQEINKLVSESLDNYIKSESLKLIGEPIPASDSKTIDLDNDTVFEFAFEIGLQPEIKLDWSKKIKLTQYEITIDDIMIEDEINMFTSRYGKLIPVDQVDENSVLYGNLVEIDEQGNIIENGLKVEKASLAIYRAENENEKRTFLNARVNDQIKFNLKKWYSNQDDISALLQINKSEIENISEYFQFTIQEIRKFEKAEIDQELFDKIFGQGVVTSEEEFRNKILLEIQKDNEHRTEPLNIREVRKFLTETQDIKLPDIFLKRWIKLTVENSSNENIDEIYTNTYQNEFKWQLIKNAIIKEFDIKVEENDIQDFAKKIVRWQFKYYYGILNMSEEKLTEYAKILLQKEEDVRKIVSDALNVKVMLTVREQVKTDIKKVSLKEFLEMK